MEKQKYEMPMTELINFETEDVITTSGKYDDNNDSNNDEFEIGGGSVELDD